MTSLLQIAPTIASYFGVHLVSPAHPIEQILKFAYSHYPVPHTVTLVVIDSLDLKLYYELGNELRTVHELVEQVGLLFECDTVSNHTTPAIASILTGLEPESHGILTSDDVGKSKIKSILELMEEEGKQAGAVIERKGAEPLIGKLSYVYGVKDREGMDIIEYDKIIKEHTISILRNGESVQMVFSHIRTIDRFAHRGWDLHLAATVTERNVNEIADAVAARQGLLLICGDHQAHLRDRDRSRRVDKGVGKVPLIVAAPHDINPVSTLNKK